jgi:hypothetical protein
MWGFFMIFDRIIPLEASGVPVGILGLYVAENESRASFVHFNGHWSAGYVFSTIPDYFASNAAALRALRRNAPLKYGARLVLVDDYAANTNKIPVQVLEN